MHQPREDAEFDFKAIDPGRAMDLVVGGIADEYAGRLTAVRADITRCPVATGRYGVSGARRTSC
ncbi:hypothetical protein ACFV2S_05750 [Streptomyces sp. NPDC059695]|uniref:hypothetical protein n=1 Tax=Streptomyces sp. NPDC059695 TaxID=3346910 RepID=UPI003695D8E9